MTTADEGEQAKPKPVHWVGSSRKDIRKFPRAVRLTFGQALFDAQTGKKHPNAKPLKGFGGAGVLEVVEDEGGSTYRAIYTVKLRHRLRAPHVSKEEQGRHQNAKRGNRKGTQTPEGG